MCIRDRFWAKLNVGNAKVKKTSSNPTVTNGNANYSFEGATFGVYSDKGCNSQLATLKMCIRDRYRGITVRNDC